MICLDDTFRLSREKINVRTSNDMMQGRYFAYAVYHDPDTHTRLNAVMRDCFSTTFNL